MTHPLRELVDWHEIGRGGFATVYSARQPRMARTVAVKILNASGLTDDEARRFRNECQTLGALGAHPHIISVFDAGTSEAGHPYLIMEYALGGPVASGGELSKLDVGAVLDLGVQISGALATAHRSGVLHRDVKPANVLRDATGGYLLADFGIATVRDTTQTNSGEMIGTFAYLAPEVIDGARASERSDVYALGTTLHALLLGQRPFGRVTDETAAATLRRIMVGDVADLSEAGISPVVSEIVHRAMATEPDDRHASVETLGRELVAAQRELGLDPTRLTVLDLGPIQGGADVVDSTTVVRPHRDEPPPPVDPTIRRAPVSATSEMAAVPPEETRRRRPLVAVTAAFVAVLLALVTIVVVVIDRGDDGEPVSPAADEDTSDENISDDDAGDDEPVVDETAARAATETTDAPAIVEAVTTLATTLPATTAVPTTAAPATTTAVTSTTLAPSVQAQADLVDYFTHVQNREWDEALEYFDESFPQEFNSFVDFWGVRVESFTYDITGCNIDGGTGTCIYGVFINYSDQAGTSVANTCVGQSIELDMVSGPDHFLIAGQNGLRALNC